MTGHPAMTTLHPFASDDDNRIVKYRPRTLGSAPAHTEPSFAKTTELLQPDAASHDRSDDYRTRMTANVAGAVFAACLTVAGIWLAITMANLRESQDCVLMSRRDCAHISSSH